MAEAAGRADHDRPRRENLKDRTNSRPYFESNPMKNEWLALNRG
jgi:hypothetical protein